ncbi:MAG TPA: SDR family oxidoreductase [Myxococcota bacterium]|jgi:hypothetical protein|nr:SDR family oxidoreductase [Myxococcota bacterium]
MTANGGGRRALVTGASSGLGAVFARRLAARGYDLVLAARRRDRLESLAGELAAEHGVRATAAAADLGAPGGAAALADAVLAEGGVDLLVNNAGAGKGGAFTDIPLDEHLATLQLNMASLTELTWRLLPSVRERRGGVINVASTAGFQPLGYHAVYAASKAYVLHFTEALAEELRGEVQVCAVCPGPTETEFAAVNLPGSQLPPLPKFVVQSAEEVVDEGLAGFDAGRVVVVTGLGNRIGAFMSGLAPRALVRRTTAQMYKRVFHRA